MAIEQSASNSITEDIFINWESNQKGMVYFCHTSKGETKYRNFSIRLEAPKNRDSKFFYAYKRINKKLYKSYVGTEATEQTLRQVHNKFLFLGNKGKATNLNKLLNKLHNIETIKQETTTIKELPNQELPNQELPNQELPNQELPNQELPNQELPNQEQKDEQNTNQKLPKKYKG